MSGVAFLDISRGSARETLGRYKRLKHWLPGETINARVDLADKIVARTTKTIVTLRANNNTRQARIVHESGSAYATAAEWNPYTVTEGEIEQLLRLE